MLMVPAALLLAAAGPHPAERLAGVWDNRRQFDTADPALRRPPAAGTPYPWLDRQHALFREVEAPGLAGPNGRAVHLVWRSGGPDGPVSRQRLWVFRPAADGGYAMQFLLPKRADPLLDAAPDGPAFRALGPTDVVGYPPACDLPVRPSPQGFEAHIPPDCVIVAGSGRTMRLQASIRLEGDRLVYSEAGLLPDGSFAFRVPGSDPYCFDRLSATLPARRLDC
jgi:hypothetical protein